jgi:hypothetical protein
VINTFQFHLTFGYSPDLQFQIPISALMRNVYHEDGTFMQCEFLITNLGPKSVGQADSYVIGDFFF